MQKQQDRWWCQVMDSFNHQWQVGREITAKDGNLSTRAYQCKMDFFLPRTKDMWLAFEHRITFNQISYSPEKKVKTTMHFLFQYATTLQKIFSIQILKKRYCFYSHFLDRQQCLTEREMNNIDVWNEKQRLGEDHLSVKVHLFCIKLRHVLKRVNNKNAILCLKRWSELKTI